MTRQIELPLLRPRWDAPAQVHALMTTRVGGVSAAPWNSLNISYSVGDAATAVDENRRRVEVAMDVPIAWLALEHGARVHKASHLELQGPRPVADATWTNEPGLACAITAADCLPVLLSSRDGSVVGAAHAGWRGLAAGVLENTVRAMCVGAGCAPGELMAWLGPCIGPQEFEVGADVVGAFGGHADSHAASHFTPRFTPRTRADGSAAWLADLPQLARDRLLRSGVRSISGGHWCTVSDASRFFSFRRDRVTGRMLAAIWRDKLA